MKTETEWKDLLTLKDVAKAQADGFEIQTCNKTDTYPWVNWCGQNWTCFHLYRCRQKQPKMKEVNVPCYFTGNGLQWTFVTQSDSVRQPHLDIIVKVPQ